MNTLSAEATRPFAVLVTALGGEGGGVLAEWLVEAATRSGHSAQSTSIPGVAQRTGATTYYVEVFPVPDAELGGRKPIFSLNPVPGVIDLLVSSELLETARQIGAGMATADRTHVLSSTSRSLTTAEKMHPADGRARSADLLALVREFSREAQVFDMAKVAAESGTVISAVMFGAIAASGVLPLSRAACDATIRSSGKGVEPSLRGFAAAFDAVSALRRGRAAVDAAVQAAAADAARRAEAADPARDSAVATLPSEVRMLAGLGHARLVDYQDAAYARLYLHRLERIVAAERAAASTTNNAFAASAATARWLALWMAFDDIVRVADLKTRASRLARVRREVKAGDGDVLRIVDHFKPGAAEIASLLPARWAAALVRHDRRRVARGHDPIAFPLKIRTDSVFGYALLRLLAAARRWRRHGSRYAAEQAAIERWLAGVEAGLQRHASLGLEIAECGRLVKGYGATNERGKENLLHVIEHLAGSDRFADDADRTGAVRAARIAALADDSGIALDRTLGTHGAPPRPLKAQPIRWVSARPGRAAAKPERVAEPGA